MRRRFLLILICASVIGLLASVLVYRVVSQVASTRSDQSEQIVVAAADMGLADTIMSQHIKLVNWPKASVPPGALRTAAEAEGRRCERRCAAPHHGGQPTPFSRVRSPEAA